MLAVCSISDKKKKKMAARARVEVILNSGLAGEQYVHSHIGTHRHTTSIVSPRAQLIYSCDHVPDRQRF